jgi:hypothetical protein
MAELTKPDGHSLSGVARVEALRDGLVFANCVTATCLIAVVGASGSPAIKKVLEE